MRQHSDSVVNGTLCERIQHQSQIITLFKLFILSDRKIIDNNNLKNAEYQPDTPNQLYLSVKDSLHSAMAC